MLNLPSGGGPNSRPGTNSRPPLNLSKTITVKQYITNVYDQFDDYL